MADAAHAVPIGAAPTELSFGVEAVVVDLRELLGEAQSWNSRS
jgi:hypothetical protein